MHFFLFAMLAISAVYSAAITEEYNETRMRKKEDRLKEKQPAGTCLSNKLFKQSCNTCVCADDGKTAVCTSIFCTPRHFYKNGIFVPPPEPKMICEPLSHFTIGCEDCWCYAQNGTTAICNRHRSSYCDEQPPETSIFHT